MLQKSERCTRPFLANGKLLINSPNAIPHGAGNGNVSVNGVLDLNGNAIGDFNMIDATTGLIIERDNGEGTADKACPAGQKATNCFHDLAKFKRIYKIELTDANAGGPVRKIGSIDLMKLAGLPPGRPRRPRLSLWRGNRRCQ